MDLTEELIKRRSKQFDLGCITLLDLSNAGLGRLANLDDCVNVLKLTLANNKISDVDGLPVLPSLLSLDLSNNCLTSIDDLPHFPALEELVLSDNRIAAIDFAVLASRLPRLRKLHIENNPVATKPLFLNQVRAAFPSLATLNGEALALFEVLSQAPATRATVDSATSSKSASVAFQLAPFDAQKFAAETSKRLEAMLREAQETLETESKRVELAFRQLEV